MKRKIFFLGSVFLSTFLLALANKPSPKVLIIGIDGTRKDAFFKAKTPVMDTLIHRGRLFSNVGILSGKNDGSDTVSGPGWSNILTGVWPDKHGVKDNSFSSHNLIEYPHFYKRLKDHYPNSLTASIVSWKPLYHYLGKDSDINIFIERDEKIFDPIRVLDDLDRKMTSTAEGLLEKNSKLTALFAYYAQVDEIGHRFGFDIKNEKYISAIERVDGLISRLIQAIERRKNKIDENWLVILCTDHGGVDLHHAKGHKNKKVNTVFMIISGKDINGGRERSRVYLPDVATTALKHLEVQTNNKVLDGFSLK